MGPEAGRLNGVGPALKSRSSKMPGEVQGDLADSWLAAALTPSPQRASLTADVPRLGTHAPFPGFYELDSNRGTPWGGTFPFAWRRWP